MSSKQLTTASSSSSSSSSSPTATAAGTPAAVNKSMAENRRVVIYGLPLANTQETAKNQIEMVMAGLTIESLSSRLGDDQKRFCLVTFATREDAEKAVTLIRETKASILGPGEKRAALALYADKGEKGDRWVMGEEGVLVARGEEGEGGEVKSKGEKEKEQKKAEGGGKVRAAAAFWARLDRASWR